MDKEILKIELVPDGCWGYNLRTVLSKDQWDFIRRESYRRAGGKCSLCGKKTTVLDAHERWEYDPANGVQKLAGIVAVCKDCHSVMHIARTYLKGDPERAENHYMKVNGATYAEFRAALKKANELQRQLNKVSEWKLDLSYLKKYLREGNGNGDN